MNTLPDAIMAAFGKFSPSMVPLSPTTERKTSNPVCIGDPNGAAPPPHSVYINPPLAPPPFASLTICENCKDWFHFDVCTAHLCVVEVGTLLSKPRHHCRNCGGTYCQACSTKSSVIPYDALMAKGEFRVCDCCFLKIREFQSQTGTTQCSWNGLSPMSEASFLAKFAFPASQVGIVVHFIKSTWFNNQIISSTISESKEAFETCFRDMNSIELNLTIDGRAAAAVAELRQKSPTTTAASTPPKLLSTSADRSLHTSPPRAPTAEPSNDPAPSSPTSTTSSWLSAIARA
ncbi:hypothetical protein AaE_012980, partial [Aphanomyces astaci]